MLDSFFKNIAIYGAGSWGSALACQVARCQKQVLLIGRSKDAMHQINQTRFNIKYLPNIYLSQNIKACTIEEVTCDLDLVIIAVPSPYFSETLSLLVAKTSENCTYLIATKGLDAQNNDLFSKLIERITRSNYAFIYGPNFANEVALGLYTPTTIAAKERSVAVKIAKTIGSEHFKISVTDDIITGQIASAIKNIAAIKSGMLDNSSAGFNARAGLITEALHEIITLSSIFGGRADTALYTEIISDLVLTCSHKQSRNYMFGFELAANSYKQNNIAQSQKLVEGVNACRIINHWLTKYQLHLPLTESVIEALEII